MTDDDRDLLELGYPCAVIAMVLISLLLVFTIINAACSDRYDDYMQPIIQDPDGNITVLDYQAGGVHTVAFNLRHTGAGGRTTFRIQLGDDSLPVTFLDLDNTTRVLYTMDFYGVVNDTVRITGADSLGFYKVVMESHNGTLRNTWKYVNAMEN